MTPAGNCAASSCGRNPHVLLGTSGTGAHMDMLATYSFATMLLAEGVRERRLLELEDAVRLLTDWPAQHFGLRNHGRVADGFAADLVVFDPVRMRSRHRGDPPRDLPVPGPGVSSARPRGSSRCSSTAPRSSDFRQADRRVPWRAHPRGTTTPSRCSHPSSPDHPNEAQDAAALRRPWQPELVPDGTAKASPQ